MKILIDCIIFEYQRYGGISEYFTQYIRYLANRNDIELSLIIYSDLDFGPKIVYLRRNPRFLEKYRVLKINGEYDLIIPSYYRFLEKDSFKKLIVVHDFIYERFRKFIPKYIHVLLKKNALKRADYIICISGSTRNDLNRFYPNISMKNTRKIYTIHNGVNDLYKKNWCNVEIKVNGPLIYIGSRFNYKNFEDAILIANYFSDKDFIIVGGDELTDFEIAKFRNPQRVKIYREIESDKLNELLNSSSFLIYPSLYEGFGIPILEAYRTGTLVLCYKTNGISEVVYPSHGDVELKDVEKLIKFAYSYLSDASLYYQESRKIEIWSKQFGWDQCFESQIQIVQKTHNIHL